MKVKKSAKRPEPAYPSLRQFEHYRKWVGVAAIGLGAMTGFGAPPRTAGVPVKVPGAPPAQPRQTPPASTTNAPAGFDESVRLRGDVAVMPGRMPIPRPAAVTNTPPTANSTNEPVVRPKGTMPPPR